MISAKNNIPNRAPLTEYLNTCSLPNQTEIVGILKYACDLKPNISSTQLPVALDVCKMMARLDLKTHYCDEMEAMIGWVDQVLVHSYHHVKKSALRQ